MKKELKRVSKIAIFEGKQIRRHWDAEKELWYFSVVDVVAVLTNSISPRKYWNDLKSKLKKEGSELSEKIGQLKMQASDGKYYSTDAADTETMLRLIQSIPSPNAEPFKLWLARVGYEEPNAFEKNKNVARRAGKKVISRSKYFLQGRKRLNRNDKYT